MKASELRIGNLVYIDKNEVLEIESITEIGANLRHGSETIYFDDLAGFGDKSHDVIKPIPLTEEWFLKFGFKKVGTNFELDFFVLWYSSYQNCFVWRFMNIDSNADRPISLKYVHQLQNLYFALTGEELTLNQDL